MAAHFATIDEYIASFPTDVQQVLEQVRRTMHSAVPDAGEMISYNVPTITLGGRYLVYFAAWKHHLSVYPVPPGDDDFTRAIAPYMSGKGTLKFPFNRPIPYDLIKRVTEQLLAQR